MRRLLPGLICLLSACATTPSAPPPAHYRSVAPAEMDRAEKAMCEQAGCLHDVRIVLTQADGKIYDRSFATLPAVQANGISVYAGQTILFEADVQGDTLTHFQRVDAIHDPARTISAKLEQDEKLGMLLTMANPFERDMKISMGIMPLNRNDLVKTTSCPVVAKGGSFEMWPYPVFQVWLSNLRFIRREDAGCSE